MHIILLLLIRKNSNSYISQNGIGKESKETEICFYSKNKNLCPSFIKESHILNPNNFNSQVINNLHANITIYIVENIILTDPLIFSSPVTYFIKGKMVDGIIKLSSQTIVNIENSIQVDFILNYSVNHQQISKVITKNKPKSIFICIDNYTNNLKNFSSLKFYYGEQTNISLSKLSYEIDNQKIHFFINQIKYNHYINQSKNEAKSKKYLSETKGKCGENLTYLFSNNKLVISGNGDMTNYNINGKGSPPWSSYLSNITTVVIQNGVRSIGQYSFYNCLNLTEVIFGNDVEVIGDSSFAKCNSLTSLFIPHNVIEIQQCAFQNCESLEKVEIEYGLEIIGKSAFESCSSINSLLLPDSVKIIDSLAFYYCYDLVILIPNNVEYIGEIAFSHTKIYYAQIPETITIINNYTFSGCSNLKVVVLPENLTEICQYAFYQSAIERITIPSNVKKIGKDAFAYVYSLRNVILLSDDIEIEYNAFLGTEIENFIYVGIKEINYINGFQSVKNFYVPMEYEDTVCSNKEVIKVDNVLFDPFNCQAIHPNCVKCDDINCFECDTSSKWIVENNTCVLHCMFDCLVCSSPNSCSKCDEKYINKYYICYPDCKTIDPHCKTCYDIEECQECEDGYSFRDRICTLDCNMYLSHCITCDEPRNCLYCEDGYEIIEGFCKKSITTGPIYPINPTNPPINYNFIVDPPYIKTIPLSTNSEYVNIINSSLELIPSKFNFDFNEIETLLVLDLPNNIDKVIIPNAPLNLEIKIDENENLISFDKSNINLKINCLKGGKIVIPSNDNITIKGNDTIIIDTYQNFQVFTIQKVILDIKNSEMKLNSNNSSIKINEMQVFYDQIFEGQSEPKKTSCDLLKIERGAKLTPFKISVDIAKIGFRSSLIISDDSVNVKHYIVYYNIPQFLYMEIPLTFHYPFPDLSSSDIKIEKINGSTSYLDLEEEFILASFVGDNKFMNKKACEDLVYKKSIGFERSECKSNINNDINYDLIAYKINENVISENSEKHKMPIGAIFGLIFDGIVLLLLILMIILLIIFKIKRKKESTDDINDDESYS